MTGVAPVAPADLATEWFVERLRCPDCGGSLARGSFDALGCRACVRVFPITNGQIRCFVSPSVSATLRVPVLQSNPVWPARRSPPASYRGPVTPRTNPRLLSILAERGGLLDVLDWGCGTAEYRPLITRVLGHRYVGVDSEGAGADVLTDVHALPFRDDSFDHVITSAVLEHVANPFLAVREVARVLRRDGIFSGSVAFMEPYHHRSYFHFSPDAVVHVLGTAGLRLEGMWPQEGWTVFESLAWMPGPVSGPTRLLLRWLGRLEKLVRVRHLHPREVRAHRWLRRRTPDELADELLTLTGQVDFVARKV